MKDETKKAERQHQRHSHELESRNRRFLKREYKNIKGKSSKENSVQQKGRWLNGKFHPEEGEHPTGAGKMLRGKGSSNIHLTKTGGLIRRSGRQYLE